MAERAERLGRVVAERAGPRRERLVDRLVLARRATRGAAGRARRPGTGAPPGARRSRGRARAPPASPARPRTSRAATGRVDHDQEGQHHLPPHDPPRGRVHHHRREPDLRDRVDDRLGRVQIGVPRRRGASRVRAGRRGGCRSGRGRARSPRATAVVHAANDTGAQAGGAGTAGGFARNVAVVQLAVRSGARVPVGEPHRPRRRDPSGPTRPSRPARARSHRSSGWQQTPDGWSAWSASACRKSFERQRRRRPPSCARSRSSRNGLSGITHSPTSPAGEPPATEVVRVQQQPVVGERQEQRVEVAGRALDVHRQAVAVRDQVVGRRRARRPLQHGVRVGDRLGVEDRAERHVVRHARLAAIRVAHERVRHQPDPAGVHPGLREQPRLDHRDEVRAGRAARASSTTTVSAECSSQSQFCPISVWPSALRAGVTANAEHSPTRARSRLARLRREHHLGAHVDREHVGLVDAGALPRCRASPRGRRGSKRSIGSSYARAWSVHRGPVPAGVGREHLAVRLDRAADAVARLLAVAATALPRAALDAHVRERHGTLAGDLAARRDPRVGHRRARGR